MKKVLRLTFIATLAFAGGSLCASAMIPFELKQSGAFDFNDVHYALEVKLDKESRLPDHFRLQVNGIDVPIPLTRFSGYSSIDLRGAEVLLVRGDWVPVDDGFYVPPFAEVEVSLYYLSEDCEDEGKLTITVDTLNEHAVSYREYCQPHR